MTSRRSARPRRACRQGRYRIGGPMTIANVHLSRLFGGQLNLGGYKLSDLDEVRDQWSHKFARPEQASLLGRPASTRTANTVPAPPAS